MAETYRQQIIDAVTARLKEIQPGRVFHLPSGGYTCQSAIRDVYPWRRVPFSKHEVPAIKIDDAAAKTEPGEASRHRHQLHVSLEIYVAGGTAVSMVRAILADVVAAIGSDPRLGLAGFSAWTDLNGHEIDVDQAGDTIAGAQLQITITYQTPLWRI